MKKIEVLGSIIITSERSISLEEQHAMERNASRMKALISDLQCGHALIEGDQSLLSVLQKKITDREVDVEAEQNLLESVHNSLFMHLYTWEEENKAKLEVSDDVLKNLMAIFEDGISGTVMYIHSDPQGCKFLGEMPGDVFAKMLKLFLNKYGKKKV